MGATALTGTATPYPQCEECPTDESTLSPCISLDALEMLQANISNEIAIGEVMYTLMARVLVMVPELYYAYVYSIIIPCSRKFSPGVKFCQLHHLLSLAKVYL